MSLFDEKKLKGCNSSMAKKLVRCRIWNTSISEINKFELIRYVYYLCYLDC